MKVIGMIPARMGSQRLRHKNLREIDGEPLIVHAVNRAKRADVFDEIWVNSESEELGKYGTENGVKFHKRPPKLANDEATSEGYIYEFLKNHECEYLVQVHTISPLLKVKTIKEFVEYQQQEGPDVLLSCVNEQIECAYQGEPINFDPKEKTNSQQLDPIQRITWSITGWNADKYLKAYDEGRCATYAGEIDYFPISRTEGHIIKKKEDLEIARALYSINQD